MAIENINLEPEIEQWENAYCGKDVRQANIDAFEKIQSSVNSAIQNVNQVAENQQTVINGAQESIKQANETLQAAQEAQTNAAASATNAAESESAAAESEANAQIAANNAAQYAKILAPDFYLDITDGQLYIKAGVGVDFYLDPDTAYLYWGTVNAA